MYRDCIDPGALEPGDLLAFAEGEGTDQAAAHVAACPACADQAASYRATDAALRSRLFRADCPPVQTIGELVLDLLSPDDTLAVRAHLALCPHCSGELGALQTELAKDPLAELAPAPGLLSRLVARLRPAPGLETGYAGVRGVGESGALTYEAGSLTVSLTVAPDDNQAQRWSLLGLVLDESGAALPAGITARLLLRKPFDPASGGTAVQEAPMDEWSNIVFSGLQPGTYDLELALGDGVVALENVVVGEQDRASGQ